MGWGYGAAAALSNPACIGCLSGTAQPFTVEDEYLAGTCPQTILRTYRARGCLWQFGIVHTVDYKSSIRQHRKISCPANVTIECDESSSPDALGIASAEDICGSDVTSIFGVLKSTDPTTSFFASNAGTCTTPQFTKYYGHVLASL